MSFPTETNSHRMGDNGYRDVTMKDRIYAPRYEKRYAGDAVVWIREAAAYAAAFILIAVVFHVI